METRSPTRSHKRGATPDTPIEEFDAVRVTCAIETEGYRLPVGARGTVVAVYDSGAAYGVEIAELPGGPEVVTLRADQIERLR
jgi:hypothetical protein